MAKKKDVTIPKETATQLLSRLLKDNNLVIVQNPLQKCINFVSDGSVIISQPKFEAEYIK